MFCIICITLSGTTCLLLVTDENSMVHIFRRGVKVQASLHLLFNYDLNSADPIIFFNLLYVLFMIQLKLMYWEKSVYSLLHHKY